MIRSFAVLALAAALAGCTITILPGGGGVASPDRVVPAPRVAITEFVATREAFRVGERVEFRIRTQSAGFVTLTARDPDGRVYEIVRNAPVTGRGVEIVPSRNARSGLVAGPPTGTHLVRAHFTPRATDERVVLTGTATLDGWLGRLMVELRAFGLDADAVAETRFDIVR
jgi:hypothetical protein